MKNIEFAPECYADTTLIKFLKVSPKIINHCDGISKVAKAMEKQADFNKVIVGIVDNDKKNIPHYFDEFTEVVKEERNLLLKRKPTSNHYLIYLCPEFEQWILNCSREVGLMVGDYNLPDNPKLLHHITQRENISQNKDFMRLLNDIKFKKAPSMLLLEAWLKEFYI
jgi:hypothetical protein